MEIYSRYLDKQIEIPDVKTVSGGEEVTIISHDALEDIVYNHEASITNNIQAHVVCVISEPGHYAFLCSISDKFGRRVEYIGESTENTLETQIAKDYPALMAYKRAFDAATIKFLGLPSKVYSDQQISVNNEESVSTGRSISAPPVETPSTPASDNEEVNKHDKQSVPAEQKKGVRGRPRKNSFVAPPIEPEQNENTKPNATGNKDDEPQTPEDSKRHNNKNGSSFVAPPLTEMDTELIEDAPASPATPTDKKQITAPAIESDIDIEADDSTPNKQDAGTHEDKAESEREADEYDTVITCGSLKGRGFTIRTGYEANPSAIHWIAEEMVARNEQQQLQQDLCRAYRELMRKKGENNAS